MNSQPAKIRVCESCGNPLGSLATSCPKCGQTDLGRTILIVFLVVGIPIILWFISAATGSR